VASRPPSSSPLFPLPLFFFLIFLSSFGVVEWPWLTVPRRSSLRRRRSCLGKPILFTLFHLFRVYPRDSGLPAEFVHTNIFCYFGMILLLLFLPTVCGADGHLPASVEDVTDPKEA